MNISQIFWDFPPFEMIKCNLKMEQFRSQAQINCRDVLAIDTWALSNSENWTWIKLLNLEDSLCTSIQTLNIFILDKPQLWTISML